MTYYREEYERTKERLNTKLGRQSKAIRQSRVEPVFGTLTQFLDMRKINVRGIKGASKCMLIAAVAYNLKKLLKFEKKPTKNRAKGFAFVRFVKSKLYDFIASILSNLKIQIQ